MITHALTKEEAEAPEEIRNVERISTVRLVRDYLKDHNVDVQRPRVSSRRPTASSSWPTSSTPTCSSWGRESGRRPAGRVRERVAAVLLEADDPVTVVASREECDVRSRQP